MNCFYFSMSTIYAHLKRRKIELESENITKRTKQNYLQQAQIILRSKNER